MANEIVIREAELKDIENLTVLKQQVWIATYAKDGLRKDFSEYVLSEYTLKNILKSLVYINRKTLIAEIDNHLIGCLELSFDSKCPIPSIINIPEISVLYILERFCSMGIGQKLLDEALLLLNKNNFKATWLTAYNKNNRALNFYRKNHFEMIGITHFEINENRYENNILLLEL